MALAITDLVNNIQGSISGLIADITGDSSRAVNYLQGISEFRSIQSELNQESWAKLIFPYTFSVVNLENPQDSGGFSDFELPLAPQSINQSEEPAINIKPTQGGTTVNHSGLGYKNLAITGTTGIAPFRGDGGVNRKTGEAIFQPKSLKYKSGYEVFIHLRNWFRTYYQWKASLGKSAKNHRLIFKNYKDGEFLIVELLKFEMDRNATRPFLYDYKLDFKVLSHYSFKRPNSKTGFLANAENLIENALDKINTARGVFLRTQGILRQIESTYDASVLEPLRQTTLAMKAFLGVPLVAADIASRTIVNTVSTTKALQIASSEALDFATLGSTGDSKTLAAITSLLDSRARTGGTLQDFMNSVTSEIRKTGSGGLLKMGALLTRVDSGKFPLEALADAQKDQLSASSLSRNFYEETIKSLTRVKQNAEDFFNLGSSDYDELFDRTSTLNSDPLKVVTNDEYDMLDGFNESITGLYVLLSTTSMFKSDFDDKIKDMVQRFNGNIDLQSNQAVKQMQLPSGITLERLALQELGDSTRWGEIAEVNSLKPPYLSDDPIDTRDGVLKPGDNILIPIPLQNGFSEVPIVKDNKLTKNMSELEKSLGVDFKIDPKTFDLMMNSSGDFELIAGSDNLAQGTILKLSYEPNEVILYPELGAGILVGKKFPPLLELKDRITSTLLQDPRISRVADLALERESSSITITFNLFVKQIDIPIPVRIKV